MSDDDLRRIAAKLFGVVVPGSVRPVEADQWETLRHIEVEEALEGTLTVARSGWYRYDSATGGLTQVTDDEADGATAGRYFDDQILPGLLEDGMPSEGIAHLRQRYIKDAVADRAAMAELRELYG